MTCDTASELLARHDQSHVLRFWDTLAATDREPLLTQVAELDFASIARMRAMLTDTAQDEVQPFEPAEAVELIDPDLSQATSAGEAALRAGEVGVLLVAGGQGTRLGFDGPKGAFPVGALSGDTLFAIHAHKIVALERTYGTAVPFYIMTSEGNDAATRSFFEEHDFFGLSPERVMFFTQGMWPALTAEGKIILDRPDHIFMGPDGHGGLLSALHARGVTVDMQRRGLTSIFYFQVDNALVEIADPAFIGIHNLRGAQLSVKVCAKRDPEEGLGMVVVQNGREAIVEYTELTHEQKYERLADGEFKYNNGSVAIHVFSVDFLVQESTAELPLHLAHKKVPTCDEDGQTVKPTEPNAFKFEKFIFDSLPHAERSVNVVFKREDEFSPVKNAEGKDSPATAQQDMTLKFARWLEQCGADVPRDGDGAPLHRIEIDPLFARSPEALAGVLPEGFVVNGDLLLAESDEEC